MAARALALALVLAGLPAARCSDNWQSVSCSAQLGNLRTLSAWCAVRYRPNNDLLEAVRRCADSRDPGVVRLPTASRSPSEPLREGEVLVGVSRVFRSARRDERSTWRRCRVVTRASEEPYELRAQLQFGAACLGEWQSRPHRCRQAFTWLVADLGLEGAGGGCVWDAFRRGGALDLPPDFDGSSSSSSSSSWAVEEEYAPVYTCDTDPYGGHRSDSLHEFVMMMSPKPKLFIKKKCQLPSADVRDFVGADMIFLRKLKLRAFRWLSNCSLWNAITDQMVYKDSYGYVSDYSMRDDFQEEHAECDVSQSSEDGGFSDLLPWTQASLALQVLNPHRVDLAQQEPQLVMRCLETVLMCADRLSKQLVSSALDAFDKYAWRVHLPKGTLALRLSDTRAELSVVERASGVVFTMGSPSQILSQQENQTSAQQLAQDGGVEAAVLLPLGGGDRRLATALFHRDAVSDVFSQPGYVLNTDVISVQAEAGVVDIVLKPVSVALRRRRCGYWDLNTSTWRFDGCELISRGQVSDVCRCQHLTHFAQLLTDDDVAWLWHQRPLEVLSAVGVALSLLGALGFLLTAVLAEEWRRRAGTRALLQLVGAVAARDSLFFIVAAGAGDAAGLPDAEPYTRSEPGAACVALGVALHYFLLAASAWTTAAAALQVMRFATIAGAQGYPHAVLTCALLAWLTPLLPVAMLLALQGPDAGYQLRDDSSTSALCFPQGAALYAAVVAPCLLCSLASATAFLWLLWVVIFPVGRAQSVAAASRHGPSMLRRRLMTAVMLFFLLGVPWLLGPPARTPTLAYLFCVTATPQGFVLFLFFVMGEPQLRSKWRTAAHSWLPGFRCWPAKTPTQSTRGRLSTTTTTTTATATKEPSVNEETISSASVSRF